MQTSSRNFLRVLTTCGWRSIRRASFSLLLSVGLWVSSSSADEVEEFEVTNSVLRIEDLSPQEFDTLAGLSRVVLGANAASASSGNITNDVASILSWLNALTLTTGAGKKWLATWPQASSYQTMGQFLGRMLSENDINTNGQQARNTSFFYEIQRALYGASGVPSSSQAILPVLWRMEAALTNNQSSVDMGWTNRLNSLSLILSQLDGSANYGYSLSDWIYRNLDVSQSLYSLQSYLASVVHSHSEGPYNSTLLEVFDSALADVWESQAYNASSTDSALRVVDANVLSALLQLDQTAQGISSEVSLIANRGPQVVVISNLQELIRHIDQVTNYQATAADEYQSAQMDYETSDVESDGRAALSYQMDETQATMDSTVSTNYDFGSGSVQNPYNPIGSMISSFGQNLDSKLPEFNETGDEIIVLFDAQSDTPMDAAGVVRVNLRETMGSYVNTCGNVMSWFWRIVNAVFTILLVLRCMREVAGAI